MNTIFEILTGMADVTRDNPTHGLNTAAKDEFLGAGRAWRERNPELYEELRYLVVVLERS